MMHLLPISPVFKGQCATKQPQSLPISDLVGEFPLLVKWKQFPISFNAGFSSLKKFTVKGFLFKVLILSTKCPVITAQKGYSVPSYFHWGAVYSSR